jgi:hypothetical protein
MQGGGKPGGFKFTIALACKVTRRHLLSFSPDNLVSLTGVQAFANTENF